MTSAASTVRWFRLLVYGLIMASAAGQFALVPVMPVYAHRLGLSAFQQGSVLAATGIAALAVCLRSGQLCERFGARRMTLLAGLLMAAGTSGQALAGGFPALFAARLAFGAGYGLIWTAGLAWLAAATPGGTPTLGATVASGGIGGVLGPAVSGVLVQRLGLAAPPFATAVLFALMTAGLAVIHMPAAQPAPRRSTPASLRVVAANRGLVWASVAVVTAGLSTSVCALLVPAELHANGATPAQTGLQFAISGAVFAIGSALTAASGRRALRVPVLCGAMLAQTAAITLAVASTATLPVVAMLYLTTMARSVLWTVSYPFAASSGEQDGIGVSTSVGMLNSVWAATTVAAPLAAAVASARFGPRGAFGMAEFAALGLMTAGLLAGLTRHRNRPGGTARHDRSASAASMDSAQVT
jgi:MFS family permease